MSLIVCSILCHGAIRTLNLEMLALKVVSEDLDKPKWKNLGTWRYVTTFKYCYPTIPNILIEQYGLTWKDKLIIYVTKEITTPKFRRYRTRFKKVFHGNLKQYEAYLKEFIRNKKDKKNQMISY